MGDRDLSSRAQQAFVPDWVFYASNDSVVAQAGALGGLRTPTALGVALAAALAALLLPVPASLPPLLTTKMPPPLTTVALVEPPE